MDNCNSNHLADRILLLNNNTGYPMPSKQEVLLLLNNTEMRNMLLFACNIIDKQNETKEIRKVLSFNTLYNDKLTSLAYLKKKEEDLISKLKEKKARLELLKEKRVGIESKNQHLINLTKGNSKRRQLSEVKNKILSASKIELGSLMNKLDKLSFIENYKYPQSKSGDGIRDNEDNRDFDINDYIEKTSGLVTLNNSLITQSDINAKDKDKNTITTANQGKIQLPKLTKDELKDYIQLNQGEFWFQIKKSIEALLNCDLINNTTEKDSLFDQSSISAQNKSSNHNNDNTNEYSIICKSFLEAIQKEEEALSIRYNENKANDAHEYIIKDNLSLIKAFKKISKEDIKKISSLAKGKLAKDILQYIQTKISSLSNLLKEKEFIIPQCVIKDDYNEIISYERNLIKTYSKYKQRTDAFISKRIIPLSDLLEEKYTDFTNTMRIEIDYFNKLKLNNLNQRNACFSLGKLKYDKAVLRSFKVNSKYDLFSLYFKYIEMIKRDKRLTEKNKKEADSIYKAKAYNEYLNKRKVMPQIEDFNKTYDFNQRYHLFTDDEAVESFKSFATLWGDIDYLNYDIDIHSLKNKFK